MFHFSPDSYRRVPEAILSKLTFAATNKLKFVVCPRNVHHPSQYDGRVGPETLLVTYNSWIWEPTNVKMLPEILNKRWQTLDVKSTMSELQRSSSGFIIARDILSSVHRFKRKEGASLS